MWAENNKQGLVVQCQKLPVSWQQDNVANFELSTTYKDDVYKTVRNSVDNMDVMPKVRRVSNDTL